MHWHQIEDEGGEEPDEEALNTTVADMIEKGKWEGWGYLWSEHDETFDNHEPYFCKIAVDDIEFRLAPTLDAAARLKSVTLEMPCNDEPCTCEENEKPITNNLDFDREIGVTPVGGDLDEFKEEHCLRIAD